MRYLGLPWLDLQELEKLHYSQGTVTTSFMIDGYLPLALTSKSKPLTYMVKESSYRSGTLQAKLASGPQ